ncbi:MAG TPA: hypothetical protein VGF81_16020 [Solirubrobacteraceae bacterium]|jgi:hypothetical protein
MVIAAPISLINPDGFYNALLKPSLVGRWVRRRARWPYTDW